MNRAQHAYPLVLLPARFYPRESCQWLTDKFCQFRAFLRGPMNLGMKAIFTCQVNGNNRFFCFFVYRYFIRMVWFCRCRRALGGDGTGDMNRMSMANNIDPLAVINFDPP